MIKEIVFIGSFVQESQCPENGLPEFAFIGRSNVGKSSLINALCEKKDLAKTSSTPGKTQLMNYFMVNQFFYLVDLPGYGYAKVSRTKRQSWHKQTIKYLATRKVLSTLLVLIDSNIEPQKIDLEFIRMLGEKGVPFVIVFTKTDKEKMKVIEHNIKLFKVELLKEWQELPKIFKTSAIRKHGKEPLLKFMFETAQAATL